MGMQVLRAIAEQLCETLRPAQRLVYVILSQSAAVCHNSVLGSCAHKTFDAQSSAESLKGMAAETQEVLAGGGATGGGQGSLPGFAGQPGPQEGLPGIQAHPGRPLHTGCCPRPAAGLAQLLHQAASCMPVNLTLLSMPVASDTL